MGGRLYNAIRRDRSWSSPPRGRGIPGWRYHRLAVYGVASTMYPGGSNGSQECAHAQRVRGDSNLKAYRHARYRLVCATSQPSPMRRRRSLPRRHPWSRASVGWPASTLATSDDKTYHFTFCFKATGAIDGNLVTIGTMRGRRRLPGGHTRASATSPSPSCPTRRRASTSTRRASPRAPPTAWSFTSATPSPVRRSRAVPPARSWATCAARVSRRWRTTRRLAARRRRRRRRRRPVHAGSDRLRSHSLRAQSLTIGRRSEPSRRAARCPARWPRVSTSVALAVAVQVEALAQLLGDDVDAALLDRQRADAALAQRRPQRLLAVRQLLDAPGRTGRTACGTTRRRSRRRSCGRAAVR